MSRFKRFNENRRHLQEGERLLDLFHRPGDSRTCPKAHRPAKGETEAEEVQDAGMMRRSAA